MRHTASTRHAERSEYQRIRLQIAELVRELESTRLTDEGDPLLLSLDQLRLAVEELERSMPERIYQLSSGRDISPETGTSLINDYGYVGDVLRNLIRAASTLFPRVRHELHAAQRALVLDPQELQHVMLEKDGSAGPEPAESRA